LRTAGEVERRLRIEKERAHRDVFPGRSAGERRPDQRQIGQKGREAILCFQQGKDSVVGAEGQRKPIAGKHKRKFKWGKEEAEDGQKPRSGKEEILSDAGVRRKRRGPQALTGKRERSGEKFSSPGRSETRRGKEGKG